MSPKKTLTDYFGALTGKRIELYALHAQPGAACRYSFPLGNYTKEEVRAIAKSRGLRTAERTESQEICFLPDNDYRGFLKGNTHRR